MYEKLKELLIKHEGLRLFPYYDTVGKLTIGVGRNLSDKGISKEEAMILLENDIKDCEKDLEKFDWYKELDEVRKIVILDMCFNLGLPKLLSFKKMIQALRNKDYTRAAHEMLDSKWAHQVGNRALELSEIMRTGEFV